MPCFRPLRAWLDEAGRAVFAKAGPPESLVKLPCGKCVGCQKRGTQDWLVRCVHEAQMHEASSFVTLTYSQEKLPVDGSLDHRHWQLFAKRVRKELGPFRFLMCGEYGGQTLRPHYHALMFGRPWPKDRVVKDAGADSLFQSDQLDRLWGLGLASHGSVTPRSVAYVARYSVKKLGARKLHERFDPITGEVWEVQPEYQKMSRRPGLGSTWFDAYMNDVFPSDECVVEGNKYRPPRYYSSKLTDDARRGLTEKRRQFFEKYSEDSTDARLSTRERVAEARLGQLRRQL